MSERKKYDIAKLRAQQGIKCPDCHCRHFSEVVKTYPKGNAIQRRRVCRHCGREMVTWERPEESEVSR